jgi:ATP-dependent helicase HrpB
MAKLLGEELGQRVGYQVKMESKHSKETKILVVTEAILVRMLQADETLSRVALIIFDEFHERSIHSDLSLALSLQVQELLREDLKILIMSATLNTQTLSQLLGEVPIISSQGRTYEVQNIYLDIKVKEPDYRTLNRVLLQTVLNVVKEDEGDILVFLQGLKDIRSLEKSLLEVLKNSDIAVLPLYSSLSKKEQDRALFPSKKRKIILATNIAQTSLTIEGVRIVVDSGLEKLSRFNYSNGMNHLETAFISQDSATQRAGRAGRVADGKCYRVWHKNRALVKSTKAEILRSDLSALILDLALWGVVEFDELVWLDIPTQESINATKHLLQELEMLDEHFKITTFGKSALSLGVHPRFAYMILKSNAMGYGYEASLLSAQLSEQSILKSSAKDSDILSIFKHLYERDLDANYINVFRAKEILKQAQFFYEKLKRLNCNSVKSKLFVMDMLAVLLLFAYPDRLAKKRVQDEKRYKLSNGKGAVLNVEDSLFNMEYLVVASLNAKVRDSYINQALSISFSRVEEYFSRFIKTQESVVYNRDAEKFDVRQNQYFLELQLNSKAVKLTQKYDIKKLLLTLVQEEGLALLTWSKKATALKNRVNFVNKNSTQKLRSFDERNLLESLESWLEPIMLDVKSVKDLQSLELYGALLGLLTWQEQQELARLAPESIKVPSGSNIYIDYSDSAKPTLEVKIQEMFGLEETPKILNATTPLQIHLLSPAMRPIQITYDLSSFWKNSYSEVRKELRGKYKRHYWPEDPYEAVATKKTKKHM